MTDAHRPVENWHKTTKIKSITITMEPRSIWGMVEWRLIAVMVVIGAIGGALIGGLS